MYNNFSSKKTKKVISALLASALVVTAAPITADAATTKVVGVNKTFSIAKKTSAKVSGLSKAEKKIVKVTISKNKKKVTVKGLKAGKATFKVGSKSYTVKVGATSFKKVSNITLTAGKSKKVTVTANNGAKDTLKWTSSKKSVATVSKATTTATAKKTSANTIKAVKAGTTTITVTSKYTGKKRTFKVTVKAATTATTAPSVTPATTPAVSATPAATASVTPATTPAVSADPTKAPEVSTTPAVSADPSTAPEVSTNPAVSATPEVSSAPAVSATPEATVTPSAAPEIVTAQAVSATALNTKTIAVTFNRDLTLDEQAEIAKLENIVVTKDKVTQNIKAAFNDAKTLYITTASEGKFVAGKYTINLKGKVAYTEEVTVEAAEVQSIAVTSTTVETATQAAVKVELLDQYGSEVAFTANDLDITVINKTDASKKVTASVVNGVLTLNTTAAAVNDELIVTVVYKTKALSASQNVKVVAEDYVKSLTLGTPASATSSRITTATTDLKIEYTAQKFYGDATAITLGSAGDYQVISSNENIVSVNDLVCGVDEVTKKNFIQVKKLGEAGTATLVFINNKTGETVNVTITVLTAAGVATEATLDAQEVTVAAGSTTYVGITVKDNYEDVLTADKFTITPSSTNDDVKISLVSDKTDANFGKIKVDASALTESTTVVSTIIVGTVAPLVLTIKVADQAKPSSMIATADTQKLMVNGSAEVKVSAVDQYAGEYDLKGKADSYKVDAKAKTTEGIVDVAVTDNSKVTVKGLKAGTEVVTITVTDKKNNTVVDAKELTFTVEANDATNFTYSVEDIAVLSPTGKEAKADNAYAKKIAVTATKKTDSNVVLSVPSAQIKSVVSDTDKVVVGKDGDDWYVAGNATNVTADVVANLTVTLLTDNGYEKITKSVTVSKEAPKTTKVVLYDAALTSEDKKEITSVTVASTAALTVDAKNATVVTLAAIDQYGVPSAVSNASVDVTNLDGITVSGSSIDAEVKDNVLIVNNIATTKANASFKVNVLVGDVYTAFTVIITGENK